MENIESKIIEVVVKIEFSSKDAHWKANRKMLVQGYRERCKGCLVCEGADCEAQKALLAVVAKIYRELA